MLIPQCNQPDGPSTRMIIFKFVAVFLLGIWIVSCGSPAPADSKAQAKTLRREIKECMQANATIEKDIPILKQSSDTLLALIQLVHHEHVDKLLIKQLADVQTSIEERQQAYQKNKTAIVHKVAELEDIGAAEKADSTYLISSDTLSIMPVPDTTHNIKPVVL